MIAIMSQAKVVDVNSVNDSAASFTGSSSDGGSAHLLETTSTPTAATKEDNEKESATGAVPVLVSSPQRTRSILKRSSPTSSEPPTLRRPRSVSFDRVCIRTFCMELGDNPSCTIGAPVELSWECLQESDVDIDAYELQKKPSRGPRFFVLNYYRRKDILLQAGFSEKEIKQAERDVARTQRQRYCTTIFSPVHRVEEVFRSAGRKMKRRVARQPPRE